MSSYAVHRTPLGVAILSVLIGIVGFFLLLVGILAGAIDYSTPGVASHLYFGGWLGILVLILFGILLLAVARGLWDTELWALVLSIIVVGLAWLGDLFAGAVFSFGGIVLLLLLVYLIAVSGEFT